MFSVTTARKNGFDLIVLQNEAAQVYAEIAPACGAILHAFVVNHNEQSQNVIQSYTSEGDFNANLATKGFRSCKLSPFACRLNGSNYQFNGQEYQTGRFVLGDHAIHGLLYDAPFMVVQQLASENLAQVSLHYHYCGRYSGFPFHYDCDVTYTLKADAVLSVTTSITNKAEVTMPIQDGWHPYFTLGCKIDELQLQINTRQKWIFDEGMIPTGQHETYIEFANPKQLASQKFDDCFSVENSYDQPAAKITNPANGLALEIYSNKNYPFLQIYTPDHRDSIAIENLSGLADCFNNGIGFMQLEPGAVQQFEATYRVVTP
jgi:aldose 1-epimerase